MRSNGGACSGSGLGAKNGFWAEAGIGFEDVSPSERAGCVQAATASQTHGQIGTKRRQRGFMGAATLARAAAARDQCDTRSAPATRTGARATANATCAVAPQRLAAASW